MKLHDKMQLNMAMDVDVHAGRPRAAAAPRVANALDPDAVGVVRADSLGCRARCQHRTRKR